MTPGSQPVDQREAACAAIGSVPMNPRTPDEFTAVRRLSNDFGFALDLDDTAVEGSFVDRNGQPLAFPIPFLSFEPNGNTGENCIEHRFGGANDVSCASSFPTICGRPDATPDRCGNRVREAGEDCDDGDGPACNADCTLPCGTPSPVIEGSVLVDGHCIGFATKGRLRGAVPCTLTTPRTNSELAGVTSAWFGAFTVTAANDLAVEGVFVDEDGNAISTTIAQNDDASDCTILLVGGGINAFGCGEIGGASLCDMD